MIESLIVISSIIGVFAWTYQQLLCFNQRLSTLELKLNGIEQALTIHSNESRETRTEIIRLINLLLSPTR